MSNNSKYEPELKEKVLRLHLEDERTKKSLTEEYHLGQETTDTYHFIQNNHKGFGLNWLLRKLKIHPNAYYNFSIVKIYYKGNTNKIFPNLLNQKFYTEKPNQVWCTDSI